MIPDSINQIAEKENLHPRNAHRFGYDFKALCKSTPALKAFVGINKYKNESIDFSNPQAVITLNKALLKHFYEINNWEIPGGYLCPPIPGRADYIHYAADLLAETNAEQISQSEKIKVLDIGTGANCVYPLIGNSVYNWQFVGSDIDAAAVRSAEQIIASNKHLQGQIEIRLQTNKDAIFSGIIKPGEHYDLTICNPPFHTSAQEARAATASKWQKLGTGKTTNTLNFGGQKNELWCPGGEADFIRRMAEESTAFAQQCLWFTTLVSKKETLPGIYKTLKFLKADDVKTISMKHGQKTTRIVAWTFLTKAEQSEWRNKFWQ